ncbi:hypothetical protein ABTE05_20260, partial [Acinetobacter baumannii]
AQADPAFTLRLGQLIAILNGGGDYAGFFTPAFQAQVPEAKLNEVTAQLIAASGKPVAVLSVAQETPWRANVRVQYEKAVANVLIV